MRFDLVCLLLAFLISIPARADEKGLQDLSLEQLMDVEVTVASGFKQRQAEAPSIVSVVTRQEIEAYGARDISDILRLIPGFEFGIDVFGQVGLGFRGIWAHEGKMLVLLDGIVQNDLGTGGVSYFGSYPASIIEKVEVIRGPGSALYGGFAEAGVISITTRSGADLDGVRLNGSMGWIGSENTRQGDVNFGTAGKDTRISAHIGASRTPLTRRDYVDFFGSSAPGGNENNYRDWSHVVVDAEYKERLKLQYVRTAFEFASRDGLGAVDPLTNGLPTAVRPSTNALSGSYEARIGQRFSLTPTLEYLEGTPISSVVTPGQFGYLNGVGPSTQLKRVRGELGADFAVSESSTLKLGAGSMINTAEARTPTGDPALNVDGDLTSKYLVRSHYGYGQATTKLGDLGLTAGLRFEDTTFGDALAPRLGLTFSPGAMGYKLLYGRSFRVPQPFQASTILNDVEPGGLRPETADTIEAEVSRAFSESFSTRANVFFTQIEDVITYDSATNVYGNSGTVQTYGAELEGRLRYRSGSGFLNFSLARPGSRTSAYLITPDEDDFLALPPAKITGGVNRRFGDWIVGPTFTYLFRRHGQSEASANSGAPGVATYSRVLLLDLSLSWNGLSKDSVLRLTGHNLLGADYVLLQPYYGGHAPQPAQDREIRAELEIRI